MVETLEPIIKELLVRLKKSHKGGGKKVEHVRVMNSGDRAAVHFPVMTTKIINNKKFVNFYRYNGVFYLEFVEEKNRDKNSYTLSKLKHGGFCLSCKHFNSQIGKNFLLKFIEKIQLYKLVKV